MCNAKAEYWPGIFKDHSPSEWIIDPGVGWTQNSWEKQALHYDFIDCLYIWHNRIDYNNWWVEEGKYSAEMLRVPNIKEKAPRLPGRLAFKFTTSSIQF